MQAVDVIKIIRRHLMMIIVFTLICGIGACIVAWGFLPDQYTSKMAIYVLTQNDYEYETNDPTLKNIYNEMFYEVSASQQITNDVARLVESNRVKDGVRDRLNHENIDDFVVDVDSSEKNRVIHLSVTYTDAQEATSAVEAYAYTLSEVAKELTEVENIKIIDVPHVPDTISGPPRLLIVLVTSIVGLLISLVIIFLKDILNTTVSGRDDLIDLLGIPVFSHIPKV